MLFQSDHGATKELSDCSPEKVSARQTAAVSWHLAKAQMTYLDESLIDHCNVPGIISEAARYHLKTGGKRFRPMFLLAVSAAVNANLDNARRVATAVELLHNASLVHDDLQDNDEFRRGHETVWHRYGTEMAINLGDYFISSTYSALARVNGNGDMLSRLVALFADSTGQVIAGQSEEIRMTRQLSISPDTYYRIARGKSGKLMALPVVAALLIADADLQTVEAARRGMEDLGVAYQIQDDLADVMGKKDGRDAGVDLREGRMSLPIIHFLAAADRADRSLFENIIASQAEPDPNAFSACLQKLRTSEAIGICQNEIDLTIRNAFNQISSLPPVLRETIGLGMHTVRSAMDKLNSGVGRGDQEG